MVTSRFLDHVDHMVVFVGMLNSIITAIIRPPITIILVVTIVVVALVMTFAVVVLTTVIGFLVLAQWVLKA
jgi:hypothetical protein